MSLPAVPQSEDGRDAIIRVTACATCGSDLHFHYGVMPDMYSGDIMGHEIMAKVLEATLSPARRTSFKR